MTEADVVFAETQVIIDTGDKEAMVAFNDVLLEAADEISNALWELSEEGGEA